MLYFSQGYSLYFFLIFVIYGGFGVGVFGLGIGMGFGGLRFSADGDLGLWFGAFFSWVGALYKNIEE